MKIRNVYVLGAWFRCREVGEERCLWSTRRVFRAKGAKTNFFHIGPDTGDSYPHGKTLVKEGRMFVINSISLSIVTDIAPTFVPEEVANQIREHGEFLLEVCGVTFLRAGFEEVLGREYTFPRFIEGTTTHKKFDIGAYRAVPGGPDSISDCYVRFHDWTPPSDLYMKVTFKGIEVEPISEGEYHQETEPQQSRTV